MNEYKILLEKYEDKIENFTIADYKKLIGDVKMFWYRNHKSIEYFISHITEDDRVAFPPSLQNIFKEIQLDLGKPMPPTGDLTRWAEQGVLLLNATLTVRAHQAASHQRHGWEQFTDAAIRALNAERENLVFILWGGYARSKAQLIDRSRHLVLESVHPSPLSANRGGWFGNHHFSQCNAYLREHGEQEIDW